MPYHFSYKFFFLILEGRLVVKNDKVRKFTLHFRMKKSDPFQNLLSISKMKVFLPKSSFCYEESSQLF